LSGYLSGNIQNCQVFVKKPDPLMQVFFGQMGTLYSRSLTEKDTILREKYLFYVMTDQRDSLAELSR